MQYILPQEELDTSKCMTKIKALPCNMKLREYKANNYCNITVITIRIYVKKIINKSD